MEGAAELEPKLGQQLQILSAELIGQKKRYLAAWEGRAAERDDPVEELGALARELKADAVICGTQNTADFLTNSVDPNVEVVEVRHYFESATEKKRRAYLQAVRLDSIREPERRHSFVCRIVKYARRVTLLDRYFARHAINGNRTQLRRFAKGAVYVARQWRSCSPYAGSGELEVELLTVGGNTGGTGYIDPVRAEKALREAVGSVDVDSIISRLVVTVKEDRSPRLFKDRFLEAKKRCWGVRHGFDSLGRLSQIKDREPTFIDPSSQDYLDLASQLRGLADAR